MHGKEDVKLNTKESATKFSMRIKNFPEDSYFFILDVVTLWQKTSAPNPKKINLSDKIEDFVICISNKF